MGLIISTNNSGGGGYGSSKAKITGFVANKKYKEGEAIFENGAIWVAKVDFVSGDAFDADDWYKISVSEEELAGKIDKSQAENFELVANKTTSVRDAETASDTDYPSEKAVRSALDGKADKIVTAHIDWVPNAFFVPAGRVVQFDCSTAPKIVGDGLDTLAAFSIVNGNTELMIGFYSNDGGITTLAGVFHVNDDMTAFVSDVLLYDGNAWVHDGRISFPYDVSGDFNEFIGIDTELLDFDLHTDISVLDVAVKNLADAYDELSGETRMLRTDLNAALTELTQETAGRQAADDLFDEALTGEIEARESGDNDLQSQIDAMKGQTRRFFVDFDVEFGTDTPTIVQTNAYLAGRKPALTPNVGTAFKNSNSTQATYNHLFVYYVDPLDSEGLILSDDGVDTVSTASASSLGVVRGAGDVSVDLNGDMKLKADTVTDSIIGERSLLDNVGNATLVTIASKSLTGWLQGFRDNIKSLFAGKVDKDVRDNRVYGTDSVGGQTTFDKGGFGVVDTVNGIAALGKNVQTDYVFETEAEFEAAKDSIPVGATVIKMYEYPENFSGFMAVPDYAKQESTNRISFTNKSWTVEKNGYVYLSISFGSTAGAGLAATDFLINGKRALSAVWSGGQKTFANGEFPVTKGDVITLSGYLPDTFGQYDSVSCYFIPPKFIATQNAVSVINKLTPYAGKFIGQPDYANMTLLYKGNTAAFPTIFTSVTGGITPDGIDVIMPNSGYIYMTAALSTVSYGISDTKPISIRLKINKQVVAWNTVDALNRYVSFLVPVNKDDVVNVNAMSGSTGNITWASNQSNLCFIPPLNVPPLFVEGADLQSSGDVGKVKIDDDDKTMTVNGEIGMGTDGSKVSINRPDLWTAGIEYNFGGGLYGRRKAGTDTNTAQSNIGIDNTTSAKSGRLISMGGQVAIDNSNPAYVTSYAPSASVKGDSNCVMIIQDNSYGINLIIPVGKRVDAPYDVWVTYRK